MTTDPFTLSSLLEPGRILHLFGPAAEAVAKDLITEAVSVGWTEVRWAGSGEAYPDAVQPIYVGKADNDLGKRLDPHVRSLDEVPSLDRRDFLCRFLALKDGWPLLLEHKLIQKFRPLWNQPGFEGFGNNASRRIGGRAAPWDVQHPGRKSADDLERPSKSVAELEAARVVRDALGHGTVQDLFGGAE